MSDVPPDTIPPDGLAPGTVLDPLAGATATPSPAFAQPAPAAAPAPAPDPLAGQYQVPGPPPLPPSADPAPTQAVARREFTSRKAAQVVELVVDGVTYRCAPSAPSDPLVAVIEAQESKNHYLLVLTIRRLVAAVMYPEDRARYEARLAGPTDEGDPIDPTDLLAHGLWLVEVYFGGRPTVRSESSGPGPQTPR